MADFFTPTEAHNLVLAHRLQAEKVQIDTQLDDILGEIAPRLFKAIVAADPQDPEAKEMFRTAILALPSSFYSTELRVIFYNRFRENA